MGSARVCCAGLPRSSVTPEQLRKAGVELYGEYGWQTRLAEALGVDGSTVRRWVSGIVPIPGPVSAAVKCFLEKHSARKD